MASIKDARVHDNLYIPSDEYMTDDNLPGLLEETEAVITGGRVGDGYMVFCGDQQWSPEAGDGPSVYGLPK